MIEIYKEKYGKSLHTYNLETGVVVYYLSFLSRLGIKSASRYYPSEVFAFIDNFHKHNYIKEKNSILFSGIGLYDTQANREYIKYRLIQLNKYYRDRFPNMQGLDDGF